MSGCIPAVCAQKHIGQWYLMDCECVVCLLDPFSCIPFSPLWQCSPTDEVFVVIVKKKKKMLKCTRYWLNHSISLLPVHLCSVSLLRSCGPAHTCLTSASSAAHGSQPLQLHPISLLVQFVFKPVLFSPSLLLSHRSCCQSCFSSMCSLLVFLVVSQFVPSFLHDF